VDGQATVRTGYGPCTDHQTVGRRRRRL